MKYPSGIPKVLDDVDEIEDNRKIEIVLFSYALQDTDLTLIAINQRSPDLLIGRVPLSGLGQRLFDDLFRSLLDTRPDTLLLRTGARWPHPGGTAFAPEAAHAIAQPHRRLQRVGRIGRDLGYQGALAAGCASISGPSFQVRCGSSEDASPESKHPTMCSKFSRAWS